MKMQYSLSRLLFLMFGCAIIFAGFGNTFVEAALAGTMIFVYAWWSSRSCSALWQYVLSLLYHATIGTSLFAGSFGFLFLVLFAQPGGREGLYDLSAGVCFFLAGITCGIGWGIRVLSRRGEWAIPQQPLASRALFALVSFVWLWLSFVYLHLDW